MASRPKARRSRSVSSIGADAIFAWLATELVPGFGFGLAEISVIAALDWMEFRSAYPTERAAGLAPIRAAFAERSSVASTRPHT